MRDLIVNGPVLAGFAAHVAARLHGRHPAITLTQAPTVDERQELSVFREALERVARDWADTPTPPYVRGVLVSGYPAAATNVLFGRYLPTLAAHPHLQGPRRVELEAARAAVRREATRWLAGRGGVVISAETPPVVPDPRWPGEWITTEEASVLLGVTPRRARQLAAGGLGVKNGPTWLLDRIGVETYRTTRRSA